MSTAAPPPAAPHFGASRQDEPRQDKPKLPVTPTDYPGFWRTPFWTPWRVLLAVPLGILIFMAAQLIFTGFAIAIDYAMGRIDIMTEISDLANGQGLTPAIFIANNLCLATLIPVAWLLGATIFGQSPRWLASVVGRFRWRWFGSCLLVLAPFWLALALLEVLGGGFNGLHVGPDTLVLGLGILLTTPLQCAGEEYGFRGFLNRAFASVLPHPLGGALLGGALSSVLFMFAHSASDPWLNVFYFSFGAIACYLCWTTGGLEAGIAMHILNNLLGEATLPFQGDISQMFDRSAGTGSPAVLIQLLAPVLGAVLITWLARRRKLPISTAPGRTEAQPVHGRLSGDPELAPKPAGAAPGWFDAGAGDAARPAHSPQPPSWGPTAPNWAAPGSPSTMPPAGQQSPRSQLPSVDRSSAHDHLPQAGQGLPPVQFPGSAKPES